MAQKVITTLIDDIDGSNAAETVQFGLDGKTYTIDLSKKNADRLRKTLAEFIKAGRTAGRTAGRSAGRTRPNTSRRNAQRPYDLPQLRKWAAKNKIAVPARGRIKQEIVDQYLAAGGK